MTHHLGAARPKQLLKLCGKPSDFAEMRRIRPFDEGLTSMTQPVCGSKARAGQSHRTRRWSTVVTGLVLALTVSASPAFAAAPLDLLQLQKRATTQRQAQAQITSIQPPSGGTLIEGEALSGATPIESSSAHGGSLGRGSRASAAPPVAPGTYMLTAAVKTAIYARADLLVTDKMAGSYGVGTAWRKVAALVTITQAGETVGVGSWVRTGSRPLLDIDWVHLAPAPSQLTTRGSALMWGNGQPYAPRGFNRAGYQDPSTKVGDLLRAPRGEASEIYAWGATMIRYGLNQEFWLANCPVRSGTVATTYRAAVRSEVEELTARGVLVMLTLTSSERGASTGCEVTAGTLREMADERSLQFWGSVATTFKNNNRIVFDLFNEPHGISESVWRNGGTVSYGSGGKYSYQAVGMQRLYNTVRATGATQLVFVSGTRWASDPRVHLSKPLDGYGIVAASHVYCTTCTAADPRPPDALEIHNSPELRARMPLTITETGWYSPDDSRFNRAMIDWAEANHVGWLVYGWMSALANGTPDVLSIVGSSAATFDAGGIYTRAPATSGAPVWNSLAPWRVARGLQELPRPE